MSRLDEQLDFSGVRSAKWGHPRQAADGRSVLPLWVADMDFETAPEVTEALLNRASFGVYGYTYADDSYYGALLEWFRSRHEWEVQRDWVVFTSGVINAIHTAIRAFSEAGDFVLIQTPVYHPFFRVINRTGRKVLENPLIDRGDHYDIDFADFEEKIRQHRPKVFLLCSPHNPIGRAHSREELTRLGDICLRYGVKVIADEIHCDLTAPGVAHTPFADIKREFAQTSVICTAPSKTFNLAGLHHSNAIIPDAGIRKRFVAAMEEVGIPGPNLFALTATEEAYRSGAQWLDGVRAYLQKNRKFAEAFVQENLPGITAYHSGGTYFLWLDFRITAFDKDRLDNFLLKEAGVWFNGGAMFGAQGEGFARVNLACPRSILLQALQRIKDTLQKLEK